MKMFFISLLIPGLLFASPNLSTDKYKTLEVSGESEHSLSEGLGNVVVVTWVNPECPFIKMHDKKKSFYNLAKKYQNQAVRFYTVNSTHFHEPAKTAEWISENQIFWQVLLDPSGKLGKEFEAKTTPHVFVFGKDGKLAYSGAFDSDSSGEAESVSNYTDLAVEALLADKKPENSWYKPYGCSVKYKD